VIEVESGITTANVVSLAIGWAICGLFYAFAPAWGRFVVGLPLPRALRVYDVGAWTMFARVGAAVVACALLFGLPGGPIIVLVIAVVAWAVTAWRYRDPR
jgi:hypothetical protein